MNIARHEGFATRGEAALMRASMAADDNPYPMRALAEQLRAIGDQGYALAEKALQVAAEESSRKR